MRQELATFQAVARFLRTTVNYLMKIRMSRVQKAF